MNKMGLSRGACQGGGKREHHKVNGQGVGQLKHTHTSREDGDPAHR